MRHAFEPPRAFLNVSDTAALLLVAARVNRQMVTKVLNPFCNACVKGAFDCSAVAFHKSPGAGVGVVRPSEVLTQREVWMGRGVMEKNNCVCVRETSRGKQVG